MKRSAYVLNGPNLNLLGTREPHIYGTTTLAEVRKQCEGHAAKKGIAISFYQSNHEGVLVDLIQEARTKADAIIFNPAGSTRSTRAGRSAHPRSIRSRVAKPIPRTTSESLART